MLLTPYTRRTTLTASSSTQVAFAATDLTIRRIKLGAPSGRIASLSVAPSPVTLSGAAGTKYIFAELAAPAGAGWTGLLSSITSLISWNRANIPAALHLLFSDDGSAEYAAHNSVVTLVASTSATPASTHQIPLGQAEWDGSAITSVSSYEAETSIAISSAVHGQCRLDYVNTTTIRLNPYNGNNLIIAGTPRQVPNSGVTLAPTGLTPGAGYYIYARWTGSAIALAASTTPYTTATNGILVKSDDTTYTLVGFAVPVAGPLWAWTTTQLYVTSLFNRIPIALRANFSTARTTNSAALVELHSEIAVIWCRFPFPVSGPAWATFHGEMAISSGAQIGAVAVAVDGTSVGGNVYTATTTQAPMGSATPSLQLSHGSHTATILGSASGGATLTVGACELIVWDYF